MGRVALRFAFACAATFAGLCRSPSEDPTPPRPLYALLSLYRSGVGLSVVGMSAEACCLSYHYGPGWSFWWFTAVVELQAGLAAWIIWSVFKRDPRPMLRDFSVVFVGSFACS